MGYITGESRDQAIMFPSVLDDYITEDNLVRFIDAFIESLDLKEMGFEKAEPRETGRPPYDPRDLLKLYIYGYLNRIRTSRKLETEAGRNVELMWLIRKLRPDFKTIADFRKDNREGLTKVYKEFNLLCRKLGMFGGSWYQWTGASSRRGIARIRTIL
jgi:transposase